MNATEIFYSNIIIFSSNERMIEVCWADICFSILSISLLIFLSFEFTFIFFLPLLLDCFFGAQKSASRKTSRSRSHIFMLTSASDHQCAALNKEIPPVPYYVDFNNLTDFPQLINCGIRFYMEYDLSSSSELPPPENLRIWYLTSNFESMDMTSTARLLLQIYINQMCYWKP